MIICSVTSAAHLYRAKVMAASVKKHHPEAKLALLLIEKEMDKRARTRLFDHVFLAKEIGVLNFDNYMHQRSIHEAAYSLKSHFIQYLFARFPMEQDLIMLDTDIKLYGRMNEALSALNEAPIVLTPHELHDAKESYMLHGVYNIGFIALRRSEEAFRFLSWWTQRVDRFCFESNIAKGLFYEQNWLNLAPALFDVRVLQHPGYNVAFWNIFERGKAITSGKKGNFKVSGKPLRFFHFSHAERSLPDLMRRIIPNRKKAIYRLHAGYMKEIRKTGFRKHKGIPWSYDFDETGQRITQARREELRTASLNRVVPSRSEELLRITVDAKPLRIVQLVSNVPNALPLPPVNQGGTEKVVHDLTEELVKLGHTVYLYAAEGSRSSANVIHYPKDLTDATIGQFVAKTLPPNIDIIHDHTFTSAMSGTRLATPIVSTHHIPVHYQGVNPVYVSRNALKVNGKNRGRFVYNGIHLEEYEFSAEKQNYLLFMGRIIKEKGVHHAIAVAEKANLPLKIAGPVKDRNYFEKEIKPKLTSVPNIEYVGAVGGAVKQKLLKQAKCLLFPSLWEEPFGLTMVEAMACGTPVLALANGAVPEVLASFPELVCHSVNEMFAKLVLDTPPSPQELRSDVATRFSRRRMADDYVNLYREIIPNYYPGMAETASLFRKSRRRKKAAGKKAANKKIANKKAGDKKTGDKKNKQPAKQLTRSAPRKAGKKKIEAKKKKPSVTAPAKKAVTSRRIEKSAKKSAQPKLFLGQSASRKAR